MLQAGMRVGRALDNVPVVERNQRQRCVPHRPHSKTREGGCASTAEAVFLFHGLVSARVNSCPSRAWRAFGFVLWLLRFSACPAAKACSLFRGLFRHE